jgi:hypothetical protein
MVLGMGVKMFLKTSQNKASILFSSIVIAIVLFFNPPIAALILATVLCGIVWNAFCYTKGKSGKSCEKN